MQLSSRVIVGALALLLLGGWLIGQIDTQNDLPSTLEAVQATLNRLEGQIKSLQQIVKQLAKDAKKNKTVAIPSSRPSPPPANFDKAKAAYRQGQVLELHNDYPAAVAAYADAIAADPRNDAAYLHRGLVRQQLGNFEQAVADFSGSLAIQPNNSRAYLGRAVAEASLGQDDKAVADIHETLLRDPKAVDAILLRARLHQQRHETQEAMADYAAAISAAPNSEKGYLERAAALRSQDQVAGSLADCDAAVKINPNSVAPYLCRASTFLKMNATGPAVEQITLAMSTAQTLNQPFPLPPEMAQLLGQTHAPVAIPAANPAPAPVVASAATPAAASPVPTAQLSVPIAPVAIPPAAAPGLPMARSMPAPIAAPAAKPPAPAPPAQPPPNVTAQSAAGSQDAESLGRAKSDDENFEEAVKLLSRAILVDPTRATAFNARGFAYLRLKQFDRAVADFTEAIRLYPQYSNAYHNRAVARHFMGDRAASAADEQKANETAGASERRPPNPLAARR